jgi:two-component system sensor histidine kinase SenX3
MADGYHVDDKALRQLLGAVTHDLRNPLAAIITNLEFAKRLTEHASVDPDLADSIEDSVVACDVLRRIVANLDVLVKGESLGCSLHDMDVDCIAKESIQRMTARAQQSSLEIGFEGAPIAQRVMADQSLLMLAIENVLANCVQHAPRGSTIRLSIESDEDEVRIVIRDDGGAIPSDLRSLAISPHGNTHAGRRDETRYGRGVALLAAHAAAIGTGARLDLSGEGDQFIATIAVPLR